MSSLARPPAPEEHLCECGVVYPGPYHQWGCPGCRRALGSSKAEFEILGLLAECSGGCSVQFVAEETGFTERHCLRVLRRLVSSGRIKSRQEMLPNVWDGRRERGSHLVTLYTLRSYHV